MGADAAWQVIGLACSTACAATCTLAAIWLARRPLPWRRQRIAGIVALCFTALWAGVFAALGPVNFATAGAESLRNLAWLALLHTIFVGGVERHAARRVEFVFASLVFSELMQGVVLGLHAFLYAKPLIGSEILQASALLHTLVAIGALVLLHNLYTGASQQDRARTRWVAVSLSALWVFELNYYAVTWVAGGFPAQVTSLRGLVIGIAFVPLAMALGADVAALRFRASRAVAFRSLSLLLIGGYLLAMAGLARLLNALDADAARLAQVGFLVALLTVTALWLPSARFRAWLKVTLQKHLFSHRYDYRAEWLRLADTIGRGVDEGDGLHLRIPKAVADITQSPSAALFVPDADGRLAHAESWRWPTLGEDAAFLPDSIARFIESRDYIVDLAEWGAGRSAAGATEPLPRWLDGEGAAWAIVPLRHFDRLQGAVLLARPLVDRKLDWEDFDLLTVVGRQLASYLSEQASQRALMEAARFDEFNRRMAFVLHDIKNLASQLSLLSHNAGRHADNPDFRADMLKTLQTSTAKLNALIARLGRYGTGREARIVAVDLAALLRDIAGGFESRHAIELAVEAPSLVQADRDGLEQALVHLIQNAIDASAGGTPVRVTLRRREGTAQIDIVDAGHGMDTAFVREKLFAPFVSSKADGFGIGALEARELVRAMGGRLDVQSRPGRGTRFTIELPLPVAHAAPQKIENCEAA